MVQPMKLSTTGLPSIKSVHDGSQSNSQNCTKRNIWTSANGFWIAMVLKMATSWKESSLEMKLWPTITTQRVNTKVWNANILIHLPRKSSKCIQPQGSSYSFWKIIERWVKQWTVLDTTWWNKACNSKQIKRTTSKWKHQLDATNLSIYFT